MHAQAVGEGLVEEVEVVVEVGEEEDVVEEGVDYR